VSRLAEILERRALLLERAEKQRADLSASIEGWRNALALADRGARWLKWVRERPYLVAIAAVAFAAFRPRRAVHWRARALMLWRLGRTLLTALRTLSANRAAQPADHPEVIS